MPTWHYIAGFAVMFACMGAILLMIYSSCKTVIDDCEKEAKQEAKHYAKVLAEHKFQEMLATTKYRMWIGIRIVDEMRKDD